MLPVGRRGWAEGGGAQGMEVRKEECSQTGDEAEVQSSCPKPWGASSDSKHPFPICLMSDCAWDASWGGRKCSKKH